MQSKNLGESINFAVQGIVYGLATQRNMKVHLLLGILVLILGITMNVSRIELLVLFLTVGLVISAELMNTAVEEVVNLITQEYHPLAERAKNVAAGAVLVSSVIALFVGYFVFADRLMDFQPAWIAQTYDRAHLTVAALAVVLVAVIGLKAFSGHADVLRGGMPSGHSAAAFCLATAIFFTYQGFAGYAAYGLAGMVAHSRVQGRIHSVIETVAGGLVGFLVTLLFFQIKG